MADVDVLKDFVSFYLKAFPPHLSGNLDKQLRAMKATPIPNGYELEIDAPTYDMHIWILTNIIAWLNDGNSYANSLNESGAFGTKNKSMHWANRAIYDACCQVATRLDAIVINTLDIT